MKYFIILNFTTKPRELQNFLSDKCNRKDKELTTDSENKFSFKGKNRKDQKQVFEFKKFEDFYMEKTFR